MKQPAWWVRFSSKVRRGAAAIVPSRTAWRGAQVALWILVALVVLSVLATEVLLDFSFGNLAGFAIAVGTLLLAGLLLRLVLWLFSRLSPRYRASLFLLLPLLVLLLAPGGGPKGAGILLAVLTVITATIGGGIAVLWLNGFRPREQKVTLTALGLGLALLLVGLVALVKTGEPPNPTLTEFHLEDRTLELPDPGQTGDYVVRTLTYGSGQDRQRPEFGEDVDLVSRSVNGSKLIDNWEGLGGWLRTSYWGFDATKLPVQGRVWHPEGSGPFPLVLIVHGNHAMEDFSDPGYGYLGELLASRGFIFVSVDENFLNSSTSDVADIFGPGLEEENDARGWLLLEHLAQWRDWNADPGHRFAGKVDMARIALIGHSRGGEAVGIAAAFNNLGRYPDDATLAFDFGFDIRGVIAIAPADGQYEPRERGTPIRDVSYFTIHGSLDGDVQSFMGSSQYSRVRLTHDPTAEHLRFKSTLYVLGANHGQFNTSWGRNDFGGGFWGLSLDTRPIMNAEAQRQIARVYFSAFLEVVLRENQEYLPIFRDARRAAAWLPDTFYLHNYADSRDVVVANFDEDLDAATTTLSGGRVAAEHLTKWREQWISLKYRPLDTHVAVAAWDEEAETETASWSVSLPEGSVQTHPGSRLFFSLSAADEGTLPENWDEDDDEKDDLEEDEDDTDEDDEPQPLDWTIVLTDAGGESAQLPLGHDRLLYPQIKTVTRRASVLDSAAPSEFLFHRFEFELDDFAETNPFLDTAAIREIRFVFDISPKGVVVIDDLGFAVASPVIRTAAAAR